MKAGKLYLIIFFATFCTKGMAQDSLLRSISDSLSINQKSGYVTGTFKALYIVNMKTIEAPAAGSLNFEIQHRFGTVNSGAYNLFGLDFATFRLGFDYGISDRVSVGIGRSTNLKTFDGYIKYKLIRQTDNSKDMPVSVSLLGTSDYYTQHFDNAKEDSILKNEYRLNYTVQVLIARKFNSQFSMELTPTFIHYNMVDSNNDQNNVFALCAGARMKITKRMAITAEYDYLFPNQLNSQLNQDGPPRTNSFSLGWDIETGGHVFQLVFTNSESMVESQYIGQTSGTWGKGYIYFGFNISRNFNLKAHDKPKIAG
jgi:opacity protein-like surface antigen